MSIVIVGNIIIQSYSQCIRQPFIISRCFSLEIHDNCQTSFFALNYANFRVPLLLFLDSLVFRRTYFHHTQLSKHQTPLLLFYRLIFSTSALDFSHQTLIHSTQFSLFPQQFSFPLRAFAATLSLLIVIVDIATYT
jgi:hypothetical protein